MSRKNTPLQKALDWAKDNLAGKSVYRRDIGKKVHFTWQGIKHALRRGGNATKIELIYDAEQLMKKAKLYRVDKDKKKRGKVKKFYRFKTTHKLKGKIYNIYIICKEGENGVVYYDYGIIKKIQ